MSPNVPIIKAPAGQIKGTELKTKYGRSISAYRVIPYADPPIGDLRFKKPKLLLENAPNIALDHKICRRIFLTDN